VPIVLKSGILSLLETSGPVKACNGIALPLLSETGERKNKTKLTWTNKPQKIKEVNISKTNVYGTVSDNVHN
jgi:hypothetical protein